MPITVEIPGIGDVDFPDEMAHADISKAIPNIIKDFHTKHLQAGQTLEGSKQAIKGGRLTGPFTPPPTVAGELGKGLIGVGKGALHAVQGVGQLAQGITDPMSIISEEMERQAAISKKPQSLATDLERIPLLGSAGAGVVEDWKKATQGTTEDFGEVLGRQGLPMFIGSGVGKAASRAAATQTAVPESANLVARLLKETGAASEKDLGALKPKLQQAIVDIHDEAINHSNIPFNQTTAEHLADHATNAADRLWKENMHPALKQAGWQRAPQPNMQIVGAKMAEGIDPTLSENAGLMKDLAQQQAEYTTQPWNFHRIEQRIQTLNNMTKSLDFKQKVGLPKQGMILRELNALRQVEADGLGQATGMDIKGFKSRWGALAETRDLLKDAADRNTGRKMTEIPLNLTGEAIKGVVSPKSTAIKLATKVSGESSNPDVLAGRALKRMGGVSQRKPLARTAQTLSTVPIAASIQPDQQNTIPPPPTE